MKDDSLLIDDTLAGDASAFGELVRRYQDRLYNTLVHMVGSADEAQDIAQDAFVQAFLKLASFQRKSAFYTWLYRIAFNTFVSYQRRKRPTGSIDQLREAGGMEPVDAGPAPTDPMEQQELAAQVQTGLAALSDEHRHILLLREMEGFSYEAIADVLELPIGTVRSRLHRARLQLRDELKEVLQENQS